MDSLNNSPAFFSATIILTLLGFHLWALLDLNRRLPPGKRRVGWLLAIIFLPLLGPFLYLLIGRRHQTHLAASKLQNTDDVQYGTNPFRWLKPLFFSLILVLLDEQGIVAACIGLILVTVYLPLSFKQRFQQCRRERLIRFAIYLAAVLLVFGLRVYNTALAKERAATIISAVEAYKRQNGVYPEKLEQIVPGFMSKIPEKAKMTMSDTGFRYVSRDGSHSLSYTSLPPFGRKIYSFEAAKWEGMD